MTVTIYTTPTCSPCKAAAKRLEREGIPFNKVDLTEDPDALEGLKRSLDVKTVQTPLFSYGGKILNIADLPGIIRDWKEKHGEAA